MPHPLLRIVRLQRPLILFAYSLLMLWGVSAFLLPGTIPFVIPAVLAIVAFPLLLIRPQPVPPARQGATPLADNALPQEYFRRYVDNSEDVMYRIRLWPKPQYEYINAAIERITGYTPEEFYADPQLGVKTTHPDELSALFKEQGVAADEHKNPHYTTRFITKDGRVIWMSCKTVAIWEAGRIVGYEGVCREITAEKKQQAELEEANRRAHESMKLLEAEVARRQQIEDRLQGALVAADMGMWAWDMASNNVAWSDSLHDLFGISRGSFDGTFGMYIGLIHPEDRELVTQSIQDSLDNNVPMVNEHRVVLADGKIRWLRGQGNVIKDADGKPVAMQGICQDATTRKQTEVLLMEAKEKAEGANRLKDSILANMSHEIRTPMTAVLGFAEILMNHLRGTEDEEYATIIHEGGTRLLYLLDSIIDLARIEADRFQLEPVVHPISAALDRVILMMRVLAEKKGLTLTVESMLPLFVLGDIRREEQVFINVINNAIRFTATGGVTISTSVDTNGPTPVAKVHITDTGVGIAATFLPFIFDEFRQESEGQFRVYEGSGLGLSIVKKLLAKMGGSIDVQSQQGVGTVVTVSLALAQSPMQIEKCAEDPKAVMSQQQTGLDILVVEDDANCRRLLVETLSPVFQVEIFPSGEEALLRAYDKRFQLVVLDVHLKGEIDGTETLRRLREIPDYKKVPIIALTAFAMKGDPELFYRAGFDAYQSKPFNPHGLRELLLHKLEQPSQR